MNKENMKHWIIGVASFCVGICLLLATANPACAANIGGTFFSQGMSGQASSEYIRSVASAGQEIYVLTDERLCRYDQETNTMETVNDELQLQEEVAQLMCGDAALWAISSEGDQIMTLAGSSFTAHFGIPWAALGVDDEQTPSILSAVVQDGYLYMVLPSQDDYDNGETRLVALDMASGSWRKSSVQHVRGIATYKEGQLLLTTHDEAATPTPDPQLAVLDVATDVIHPLVSLSYETAGAPAYDREMDRILFTRDGECLALQEGGQPEIVGYMPIPYVGSESQGYALPEGQYAVYSSGGLYVRAADKTAIAQKPLRVAGWDTSFVQGFNAAYPDIPAILVHESFDDTLAYANAVITGGDAVDVFEMNVVGGIDSLIEKGYVDDISSSAALLQDASEMYPQIQQVTMKDGMLYAVPADFSVGVWQYASAMWDELQLAPIPETMEGFFSAYRDWETDMADDHMETAFARGRYDEYTWLLECVIGQHLVEATLTDEIPSVDTQAFWDALQALEALGKQPIDFESLSDSDSERLDELMERQALIRTIPLDIYDLFSGSYDQMPSGTLMLMPSIQEGAERYARFSMNAYIMNPNTTNKDAALKFLEYVATNREVAAAYAMKPGLNDPVEDPYFVSTREELENYISGQRTLLETASPEDALALEDDIQMAEANLESVQAYRWQISEENIASYRALAEHLYMPKSPLYASGVDPLQLFGDIITRYAAKQISLEQFINLIDEKIRMVYLEGM